MPGRLGIMQLWLYIGHLFQLKIPSNFRKTRHAPTFRNRKFSTSLREYSIFFPSEAMAEPDGKFSLHESRPKNIFQTHENLNLLSVLRIRYSQ